MPLASDVPAARLRLANQHEADRSGDFVLYWMIANRRTRWNFSLQRAVDWARELDRPLLIFEPLRAGYQWASDRLHNFVIQGMADNAKRLSDRRAFYYPYLEPEHGDGKGLLKRLAQKSCVVVTDDYPAFFLPRMLNAVSNSIPVRFELVDSNGLLPMRVADQVFVRAHYFRRFLQKNLTPHLQQFPQRDPLSRIDSANLE